VAHRALTTRVRALLIATLSAAAQLSAQPISEVEITADGLHRVDPTVIPFAWLHPDADLTHYARAFVLPTFIVYRELSTPSRSAWSDTNRSAFPLSDKMKERLEESFGEAFHEIMDSQRVFDAGKKLGRDVIMIRGYLSDVATGLPPDKAGADVDQIRWAWEANVTLELVDSMSDTVLFRSIDRQRVEGPLDADLLYGLAPRVARQWSRTMADRIQDLSSFYPSRLYRLQERAREAERTD
jgi:hypothetical protein